MYEQIQIYFCHDRVKFCWIDISTLSDEWSNFLKIEFEGKIPMAICIGSSGAKIAEFTVPHSDSNGVAIVPLPSSPVKERCVRWLEGLLEGTTALRTSCCDIPEY